MPIGSSMPQRRLLHKRNVCLLPGNSCDKEEILFFAVLAFVGVILFSEFQVTYVGNRINCKAMIPKISRFFFICLLVGI